MHSHMYGWKIFNRNIVTILFGKCFYLKVTLELCLENVEV